MARTKRRLNLLIDSDLLTRLQEVARQKDLSVSWLIRKGAELLLDRTADKSISSQRKLPATSKRKSPIDDPILRIIGLFRGPTLSSRAIDRELHGTERR
jgi:hypothetical protein